MPEDPVDNYLLDTTEGVQYKLISTPHSGKPFAAVERTVDDNGVETQTIHPWVEAELPDGHRGKFVLHVFEKAKDSVKEHPKTSAAFTLATVVTGVATAILVTRRKHKN